MKVTKSIVTNAGVLEVSDNQNDCFIKFNMGDNQWHRVSGADYDCIIGLGRGWFYLSPYWEGCGLPTEVPFQVNPAQIYNTKLPQGLDSL